MDIHIADQDQARLLHVLPPTLHLLHRIEHFHRSFVIHRLGPLVGGLPILPSLPTRARDKEYHVRTLEDLRELGYWGLLQRQDDGCDEIEVRVGREELDGGSLGVRADDGFDSMGWDARRQERC